MIYRNTTKIDLSQYDNVLTVSYSGHTMPMHKFIENFLYIKDAKTENVVPFKFNFAQKAVYEQLCMQKMSGRPMRQTILKARQLGCSTLIAGIFFTCWLCMPNTRWCVLADKKDHAQNIFEMYQFFYDHLNDCYPPSYKEMIENYPKLHNGQWHPDDMRPKLKTSRQGQVLITETTNSRIEVIVADKSAGRSASYTGIHSSETAWQKDLNRTITAMDMTVKSTNPNSMVFYETTANGFNEFKDKWDFDSGGNSEYEATFFPWFLEKSYSTPLNVERDQLMHDVKQEEWLYKRYMEHRYQITDEQLNWYYHRYLANQKKKDEVLQELPFSPMDSFKSTGQSVFDLDLISSRLDEAYRIPKKWGIFPFERTTNMDDSINFKSKDFVEDDGGHWIVYEFPEKSVPYVCIADPSGGHGNDNSCIQVMNNITQKQCAVFTSNTADQVDCAYELMAVGYFYNTALVSMENNEINRRGIDILVRAHYPKIYVDKDRVFESTNQNLKSTLGHRTDNISKDGFVEDLRIVFKEHPEIIRDIETLNEMSVYQRVVSESGNYISKGKGNKHDDRVLALCPFWRVREQQSKSYDESQLPHNLGKNLTPAQLEEILQKNFRTRMEQEQKQENSYENSGWC